MVILLHRIGQPLARGKVHRPLARHCKRRRATLRRMLALAFNGDLLVAPDIQLPLRKRLLVQLAPFRRGGDRIKHPTLRDTCLHVLSHQLVAIHRNRDARILWLIRSRGF